MYNTGRLMLMRLLLSAALALTVACTRPRPQIAATPTELWADSYDSATVTVTDSPTRPRLVLQANPHTATATSFKRQGPIWTAEIHTGVLPGMVRVTVEAANAAPAHFTLTARLALRDSFEDGTPDFLRLDSEPARAAFRRWFTYLAEVQYFQAPEARPAEISDCAALIRYAYRESLRTHEAGWAAAARLPLIPAFDSPGKYEYPFTPLGANLFRIAPGPFRADDLTANAFAQFADAKTLWRYNTHSVSRDLARAEPGDILFYRQSETYHSMIYLGQSQIQPDGLTYVLYHTGPRENGPGELRRLTLDELRNFPAAEWRPDTTNPHFLGIYRWNILVGPGFQPAAGLSPGAPLAKPKPTNQSTGTLARRPDVAFWLTRDARHAGRKPGGSPEGLAPQDLSTS